MSEFKSLLQGEVWKRIKNQFAEKVVFPLVLYFDDVEINNPLGTHRGVKKLGALYYFIASIPYEYSSKLENIFLAQIHRTINHTDFQGQLQNNVIFANVIEQIIDLERNGITVNILGEQKQVYFALATIIGDNLGLNIILGFTRSFNMSRCCRICLADGHTMRKLVKEDVRILRTSNNYKKDVDNRTNGVTEECVFNRSLTYSVIDQASLDPTHDLNEGICRYEVGLILHSLIIKKKNFSLEIFNSRLRFFGTDSSLLNTPLEISVNAVTKKYLISSAAEMSYLVHYFALIIGDLVPPRNKVWQLYILLRKIMCMVMQPIINDELCKKLENIISTHHKLYLKLLNENLKPKHHFLLHYPRLMQLYGPLKHLASIRLEAKHKNLTNAAKNVSSRVNPAHTVALKVQLQQCYRFTAKEGFSNRLLTGPKNAMNITNLTDFDNFKSVLPKDMDDIFYYTSWVNVNGTTYKNNMQVSTCGTLATPEFYRIKYILINEFDKVYFLVLKLCTISFVEHFQAFEVEQSPIWAFVSYDSLIDYVCYSSHISFTGKLFVPSN